MSATPLLQCSGVSKSFAQVHALVNVDFEVRRGEVMALVGDNGAGKSTLIKCIAGIYPFDSGEVRFEDEVVHEGVRLPKTRRWYTNADSTYLGADVIEAYERPAPGGPSGR